MVLPSSGNLSLASIPDGTLRNFGFASTKIGRPPLKRFVSKVLATVLAVMASEIPAK